MNHSGMGVAVVGNGGADAHAADPSATPLWEPVHGLDVCERCSTLAKLRVQKCVKQLKGYFEEAGCVVTLGFNPGSGDVSFTLKPQDAGAGADGKADADIILTPSTPRGEVIVCMLGLHPDPSRDPNAALDVWNVATQVALIDRKYNRERGSLTVVVKPFADCRAPSLNTFSNKTAKYKAIRYSPSMRALDEGAGVAAVVARMIDDFWQRVRAGRYVPATALVDMLTPRLEEFLASGITGVLNNFTSTLAVPCGLYLLGAPGTGKSSFVHAFAGALEAVLTRYLDSTQKVAVVKVPLNAVTQDTLKKQALVRGLSDHSIERIVEQTLCNGHVVMLHLEENPEDVDAQVALLGVVEGILGKLVARYPQYAANVITVCTSNHAMADAVAPRFGTVIPITSPELHDRRKWMAQQISGACPQLTVQLRDAPETADMRQLVQWCITLSHHMQSLAWVRSDNGNGGADDIPQHVDPHATSTACPSAVAEGRFNDDNSSPTRRRTVVITAVPRPRVDRGRGEGDGPGAGSPTASASTSPLWRVAASDGTALLTLATPPDSLFCYPAAPPAGDGAGAGNAGSETDLITPAQAAQIKCVVEMARAGQLSPGVVVITGGVESARCEATVAAVNASARAMLPRVAVTDISVLEEADAGRVFGEAHQIRGGLFKFIDDNTCAHAPAAFTHVLVNATVSAAGQFILRELLEQGDKSRTHRLAVSKRGCLFVLLLQDAGDAITPQVYSRAHLVL